MSLSSRSGARIKPGGSTAFLTTHASAGLLATSRWLLLVASVAFAWTPARTWSQTDFELSANRARGIYLVLDAGARTFVVLGPADARMAAGPLEASGFRRTDAFLIRRAPLAASVASAFASVAGTAVLVPGSDGVCQRRLGEPRVATIHSVNVLDWSRSMRELPTASVADMLAEAAEMETPTYVLAPLDSPCAGASVAVEAEPAEFRIVRPTAAAPAERRRLLTAFQGTESGRALVAEIRDVLEHPPADPLAGADASTFDLGASIRLAIVRADGPGGCGPSIYATSFVLRGDALAERRVPFMRAAMSFELRGRAYFVTSQDDGPDAIYEFDPARGFIPLTFLTFPNSVGC